MQLILLGDSILDNGAYVDEGEEVSSQLRRRLSSRIDVELLARDGAVIAGVARQLEQLPASATHLLISAGGNDALQMAEVLTAGAKSVADALSLLATRRDDFQRKYSAMLDEASGRHLPVSICTIYDVQWPDPMERKISAVALTMLNDLILREAAYRRLPVIDLRVIFREPGDFANAIEPSAQGGAKLAAAVSTMLTEHDFGGPASLYVDT
jgi:hypothetical protein